MMMMTTMTTMMIMMINQVHGAGMATHTMVGVRTAHYYGKISKNVNADFYNDILANHTIEVISGADFPDFLYLYSDDRHEMAEEAHWPPWQAAAAKYIRSLDFRDPSEDTQKLIAFLFGVSIHYAADKMWEGLSNQLVRGQGFTSLIGQFNLGDTGMGNDNESVSNMASDFLMPYLIGTGDVNPWTRYYPLEHVVNIYNLTGRNVSLKDLEESKLVFDLALWAENTFGPLLVTAYSELYKHVPAVDERVIESIGGIDDMAFWASSVWERVANWLEEGPPDNPPPRRRRKLEQAQNMGDLVDIRQAEFVQSLRPYTAYVSKLQELEKRPLLSFVDETDVKKGLVLESSSIEEKEVRDAYVGIFRAVLNQVFRDCDWCRDIVVTESSSLLDATISTTRVSTATISTPTPTLKSKVTGTRAVSYHGRSIATGDFDGDGKTDTACGAPGYGTAGRSQVGAATISYGNNETMILEGHKIRSRFGHALTVLDFNLDGYDDLVVSAPFESWNDNETIVPYEQVTSFRYWGSTYVYFGSKSGLDAESMLQIDTQDDFTMMGLTLKSGDVNGDGKDDLIVGTPSSSFKYNTSLEDSQSIDLGGVFAFVSRNMSSRYDVGNKLNLRADCDVCMEGPQGYDEFGYSISTYEKFLLVGAPGHRPASSDFPTGAVYVYELDTANPPKLVGVVEGDEELAEFGSQVSIRAQVGTVAVSSPSSGSSYFSSHLRGGSVVIFDLKDMISALENQTVVSMSSITTLSTLEAGEGGLRLSRFGTTVRWLKSDGSLAIAAPMWTKGSIPLLSKLREAGSVYIWSEDNLPSGSIKDIEKSCSHAIHGTFTHGRLGLSIASLDSGVILIGSPLADSGDGKLEMAGIVSTYQL